MVVCGCRFMHAAAGLLQAPTSRTGADRRQVRIGGRRVKTVDIHAHVVVPEASALVSGRGGAQAGGAPNAQVIGPDRLKAMDEQGIDVEALSINANWYATDRDLARQIINIQNARLAELCAAKPDRFVAFASVALQHPDLAAEQLEEAHTKYRMRGAAIGGSVEGEELSAPRFDPFWAKAEALGMLIFIHPQNAPGRPTSRLQGNGLLNNVIGNPLETTIALSHLIFEGTLDRFPGLRICAAHGGGYLPSYSARSDHGCLTFPDQCQGRTLKKRPSEYLRQIYVDSLVFTAEGLRHLVAECGAGQVMMGTDYPFPWTSTAVDHVLGTPGLSDADRQSILGGTACKLLNIPA
jgi:aminocarboxymuconate-semialdehyde decarboxylase